MKLVYRTSRTVSGRRTQIVYALALLALLAGTCFTIDLLARDRDLEQWLTATISAFHKKTGKLFSYTGNFIDFEDRLMVDEVRRADYSRGGVYFFGTSNMKWAFQTWDLPENERRFIHIYGIGASNHTLDLKLINYLRNERGFLTAGDRDLVYIGVSSHLALVDPQETSYFYSVLRRHSLYTIAPDGGIADAPMSGIERWFRTEKARSSGFLWNLGRLASSWVSATFGSVHHPNNIATVYQEEWRKRMGPNWRQNMDEQLGQFRETIALLRSRGATVKIIMLPQATWIDPLPFKSAYETEVRAICQESATPIIDLSRAFPDDEFVDSNHLTAEGQGKFRGMIMGEVEQHLREIGALESRAALDPSTAAAAAP